MPPTGSRPWTSPRSTGPRASGRRPPMGRACTRPATCRAKSTALSRRPSGSAQPDRLSSQLGRARSIKTAGVTSRTVRAVSNVLDDLTHPIVLAPLGGGPATPALAAAVCEAGGLGFLAAGYRTTDDVRAEIRDLRRRTASAFGVNVFVPGDPAVDVDAVRAYVATLQQDAERLGVTLGEPHFDD